MQASDPLNARACSPVKAQPGNAGSSRKPGATAGLTAPARDAIDVLRARDEGIGPCLEQRTARLMRAAMT